MMLNMNYGQPSTYFPLRINKSDEIQRIIPIQFPSTRNVLWESKPVGDFETLSLTLPKEDVQLFVVEKTLRLAQRYSEGSHSTSFLLGSVYPKTAEGGICFGVDRFDPGREVSEKIGDIVSKCKVPTAVVPGDHIIPIKVKNEQLDPADSFSHTKDEFSRALQIISSKICGKDSLTLSHIISLKANIYCTKNDNEVILSLHCGAIVPDVKFQVQLIAPLPIIPTALARNLAGPLRLSDVQGAPKMGFITMDQTRKLLLLLESDPKAYNLPLIGIWISGVYSVHHPYVWTSCLRYLNCTEINDRVLHASGSFLMLHYSVVQRLPDFWECRSNSNANLDFELLSCQEELHFDVHECNSKDPLCFLLSPAATDGINKTMFNEAIDEWKNEGQASRTNKTNAPQSLTNIPARSHAGVINDETPRPSPSPHPSPTQVQSSFPPVPEDSLSLSFDDMANNKKDLENRKENTMKLAPHFNGPTKRHSMKAKNSENSLKPSRKPFKEIISQNHKRAASYPLSRENTAAAKTPTIERERDKENRPLSSAENVRHPRKQMITGRSSMSPIAPKTDEVFLNHSPRSAVHQEKEQRQLDKEGFRAQSRNCSRASQDLNNSNERSAPLSEPRFYSGKNQFQGSQPEKRPMSHLNEPKEILQEHSNHSSVISANELNIGDISTDSSSWEDCEDVINSRKIMPNHKMLEVAHSADCNSCNFTEIPKQQDGWNFEHSQKEPASNMLDIFDVNQSHTNEPLQEKQQTVEKEADNLPDGRLQEQVKKQDDMIRVLQEQVRSLLQMKEAISSPASQDPCLPMTPASTPEDGRKRHTENQNDSVSSVTVQTHGDVVEFTPDEPRSVTVGVNTGTSLLWNEPIQNNSRCERCCECYRYSKQENGAALSFAEDPNDKQTPEKSESLENLSEVVVHDESNQSLPLTLNAVEISSFDGSSSVDTDQNFCGESPILVSDQPTSSSKESSHSEEVSVKGREFYDKLLIQVKDLLSEQVNDGRENVSSHLKSREVQEVNTPSATAIAPTREVVVKATLKELEKIKHFEYERPESSSSRVQGGSPSILQTYQRSMSTSFIPDHPRLNYISMSVDETFDEVTYLDEVALKYLSDEEINGFKNELRPTAGAMKRSFSRTVRFGSLPERERNSPLKELRREVDFTWNNLSFCTKDYLTKYNLVEKHISFSAQEKNQSMDSIPSEDPQESLEVPCKPLYPSPVRKTSEDKNDILDIQRLKNLPKLF